MSFESLGLSSPLLRSVAERGFLEPTAVQAAVVPAILRGADVWAEAQTGSGKTAAFVLPLLQRCVDARLTAEAGPRSGKTKRARQSRQQALVLVPTRELAAQVGEAFRSFAQHLPQRVKVTVVFGGVSINPQLMALRGGADFVVATPGRLLDLVDHNALQLGGVRTLVLDEADRLLDLGFADELARVLAQLPARRHNLLFSATFPPQVLDLVNAVLKDPVRVRVAATPAREPDLLQRAFAVDPTRRTPLLRHLIASRGWSRVLVFVATKYATLHVADKLRRAGLTAQPFNGELSQGARTRALADFKAGRLQVLVATDVAARGIDIVQLPAVVNYDLPRSTVDYTHRIGRTARAGARGEAVSFITPDNEAHFRLIEKRQQRRVPREVIAGFEPAAIAQVRSENGVKSVSRS
ncbi:MAG TPA: DEAD/DEAH box helicase [Steroidobacteraceae bacterium]|nr:DEAD/DEAH box helicase [Steroidobacteraceae bacterium]